MMTNSPLERIHVHVTRQRRGLEKLNEPRLLVSQSSQWIFLSSAPGRQNAGGQTNYGQDHDYRGKGGSIENRNAPDLAGHETRQAQAREDADDNASSDQAQTFLEHHKARTA